MSAQETLLLVSNLRLEYGGHVVAEGLDLAIHRAEITAIIGPNGSGKSTLLKALARLLRPGAGSIKLQGKDLWSLSEKEAAQKIAFMPQSASIPPDLTVAEVLRMGRLPYRSFWSSWQASDDRICQKVMQLTGLQAFAQRSMGALSGGERQRVRLALALVQEPQILLLDEPTTYLDIRHQLELMAIVTKLHEKTGLTVVMVLHDLNQAVRYSKRLVAMKEGRILADGKVAEVFSCNLVRQLYGVENEIKTVQLQGEMRQVFFPSAVMGL